MQTFLDFWYQDFCWLELAVIWCIDKFEKHLQLFWPSWSCLGVTIVIWIGSPVLALEGRLSHFLLNVMPTDALPSPLPFPHDTCGHFIARTVWTLAGTNWGKSPQAHLHMHAHKHMHTHTQTHTQTPWPTVFLPAPCRSTWSAADWAGSYIVAAVHWCLLSFVFAKLS